MKITITIIPPQNNYTFASVKLVEGLTGSSCFLNLDYSKLVRFSEENNEVILDLVLLSSIIYAIDRWIRRENAKDNWTRDFSLCIPVSNPDIWTECKQEVNECLSFLSGDKWNIEFEKRIDPLTINLQGDLPEFISKNETVSLFSGGLDSLVGVINWLELNKNESIMLVGHHDPRIAGTLSDQKSVLQVLKKHYPRRIDDVLIAVGANQGWDNTLRSRSLLFCSLGIFVAKKISNKIPLLIPENGTMALNIPLTPSRVGSCSTRTVHPFFLTLLRKTLNSLGVNNPIINPFEFKTKGEVLADCLNRSVLLEAIPYSASCSKRGHTRDWIRRGARQCGSCIPCIYRRAALHHIGQDNEIYGRDICTGEVEIKSKLTHAEDIRAYLSFVNKRPSRIEISQRLLASGKLNIESINAYSDVIIRAMEEVRILINDKGDNDIKEEAGL